MSTEQVLDAEDQMAAALAELRQEKSEPTPPEPAPAKAPAPAPETLAQDDTGSKPESSQAKQEPPANTQTEDPAEAARKTREELHRLQSEVGRVGALNRRYNETKAQLEQVMRENADLKSSKAQVPGAAASGSAAAKLAELSEKVKDFPELHGLVSAVAESLQEVDAKAAAAATRAAAQAIEPLQVLRAESEQRRQQERDAAYEAALTTFQGAYPTAVDVIKGPDFQAWIPNAPKQVQDAFRNGSTPDEAIAVMDAFDAHMRRSGKPSIAQAINSQPAAADAATQKTSNAARLSSAAGLPSRASGAKGGMPPEDDFEASLDFFRKKRLREQAAVQY